MPATLTQTIDLDTGTYRGERRSDRGGWVLSTPDGTELPDPYTTWGAARNAAVSDDAVRRGSTRARGGQYVRWSSQRNLTTGTAVNLLDLAHKDSPLADAAGPRWGTECVPHGVIARHPSCEAARTATGDPREWCPTCRETSETSKPTLSKGTTGK